MSGDSRVSRARLGELLLQRKLLTREQLNSAIAAQQTSHLPLGEILLERELITARQIERSLKWQSFVRLAAMVTTVTLAPAMAIQASVLGEETGSRRLENISIKSELNTNPDVAGGVAIDTTSLINVDDLNVAERKDLTSGKGASPVDKWRSEVKGYMGTPMYTFLKGEYRSGVDRYSEGLVYKTKWSKKGLRLEVKYQF